MVLQGNYHCQECGQEFESGEQLAQHARSQHSGGQNQYRCQACGTSFQTQEQLEQHNRQMHAA